MKFFDKALKQAQAQRPRAEPLVSPEEPQTGINPLPPEGEPTGSPKAVQEICYTHTRKVPVDVNTLIRNRLIVGSADTAIVQGYKLLRTHILQKTWDEHRNILMVISPLPDDGKTLTATNLAISMAQELDKTVLLVDADLRSPSINRYFGMQPGKGLMDYLEGRMSIPDILGAPSRTGSAGNPAGRPADRVGRRTHPFPPDVAVGPGTEKLLSGPLCHL